MISLIARATGPARQRPESGHRPPTPSSVTTRPAGTHRQLFLRELELDTSIGVYPEERQRRQPVRISISALTVDRLVERDEIDSVVSYEWLRDVAHQTVADGHINLVETLAERIAAGVLAHADIIEVTVSVEKPAVFDDCAGAGVEMTRRRADLG